MCYTAWKIPPGKQLTFRQAEKSRQCRVGRVWGVTAAPRCRCPPAAPVCVVSGRARLQHGTSPWMLVADSQTVLADRWPTVFYSLGLRNQWCKILLGRVKFWGYFYTFYWKHSPFLEERDRQAEYQAVTNLLQYLACSSVVSNV